MSQHEVTVQIFALNLRTLKKVCREALSNITLPLSNSNQNYPVLLQNGSRSDSNLLPGKKCSNTGFISAPVLH